MAERAVVVAPSRLHFGMYSPSRAGERPFGGLGAMIDAPGMKLHVRRSDHLTSTGPLAARAMAFAKQFGIAAGLADSGFQIEMTNAPPDHVGLGVGTQLALSVAAGIAALSGQSAVSATRLAEWVGRGERSAIGTHGFESGGLLLDAGKRSAELVSPLLARAELPAAWRFVLIIPRRERGVHGPDERQAFGELPPISAESAQQLLAMAGGLIESATRCDFPQFSETLYQFNRDAGEQFSKYQHGAYANERVRRLVERLRNAGVAGVGQSSWGPTVFALTADAASARNLVEFCGTLAESEHCDLLIGAPQNSGACIERE